MKTGRKGSEARRQGPLLLVVGVAGSGKTTVARRLAESLGLPFRDADDYHGAEARARLARDEPLDDTTRAPMLERLATLIPRWAQDGGAVVACSALKQAYRDALLGETSSPLVIYLRIPYSTAQSRLSERRGFHPLVADYARIVAGQFRDLEEPVEAIVVDADRPLEEVVHDALAKLRVALPKAIPRTGR